MQQTTTIELFPVGETDVIVYQWDYSGSSTVQFELEDSTILAEETVAQAASIGQVQLLNTSDVVLRKDELVGVLKQAGWPEALIPEALRVIDCESRGNPNAIGDSGRSVGLFQLNKETWFRYAGTDPEQWADPYVNAITALATYNYDISRGHEPWRQWSCKS